MLCCVIGTKVCLKPHMGKLIPTKPYFAKAVDARSQGVNLIPESRKISYKQNFFATTFGNPSCWAQTEKEQPCEQKISDLSYTPGGVQTYRRYCNKTWGCPRAGRAADRPGERGAAARPAHLIGAGQHMVALPGGGPAHCNRRADSAGPAEWQSWLRPREQIAWRAGDNVKGNKTFRKDFPGCWWHTIQDPGHSRPPAGRTWPGTLSLHPADQKS
jgi:hypothetical protein